MARIRAIKPGFFKDSELYDAEKLCGLPLRIAYAGLWTVADREGRFKWKPREIKVEVLPYDDCDMGAVLEALTSCGKIFKYKANGFEYGFIPKFLEHQHVNRNEAPSTIPAPPENNNARAKTRPARASTEKTIPVPVQHHELLTSGVREQEGKGKEGKESSAPPSVAPPPEPPASKPTSPTKGRRWGVEEEIPPNWTFEAENLRAEHGLPPVDLALEATKFANYWIAKTGRGSTHADWKRTWLNWALNANASKLNGKGISAHDKGTLGLVQFVANAERSADATDSGSGAGTPRNPLPTNGHGPAQMADDGRRFLVRLPALDGSCAPGSVPALPNKP